MNQPSFARFQSILPAGGLILVNSSIVNADDARSDIEVIKIPVMQLAEEVGNAKVANMIMVGALVKLSSIVSFDALVGNLAAIFGEGKAKLIKKNQQALELGYSYIKE